MIVRLPPSSMFRAAPKNRLGLCSAPGSSPPESVRPVGGMVRLYARARRVMLSISMTTSLPCSTSRCARSSTISATRVWLVGHFIEGGINDFAPCGAFHIRHFFGAFVNEQHDQVNVRIIVGNTVCDLLEQDRLAGFGRGHDESRAVPGRWVR